MSNRYTHARKDRVSGLGDHHWKAVSALHHHGWDRVCMRWPHVAAISLSVVTQRSSTAFIVLYEAAPTSFQPRTLIVTPLYICTGAHACMLNKAYICMIFFFILKIICQIYFALPMHYYLHLNCMRRQLLTTWSNRRIHAKTPDIFEILSTVQKVGLSMVCKSTQHQRYYGTSAIVRKWRLLALYAWWRTENFVQNDRDCCRLTTNFVFLLLW